MANDLVKDINIFFFGKCKRNIFNFNDTNTTRNNEKQCTSNWESNNVNQSKVYQKNEDTSH